MRVVVAISMGFLSGFLIYMMLGLLFTDFKSEPSPTFVFVTFVGGWILSSYILLRGTRTTAKVFARGFLLGAAEWFAMVFVGAVTSGRAVGTITGSGSPDTATAAGAALGGGIAAFLTGGISVAMAVVCIIGWVITTLMGREMKTETQPLTRKCPECAELIQPDAKKCSHCGATLSAPDARRLVAIGPILKTGSHSGWYCAHCGTPLLEGASFCQQCGQAAPANPPKSE